MPDTSNELIEEHCPDCGATVQKETIISPNDTENTSDDQKFVDDCPNCSYRKYI